MTESSTLGTRCSYSFAPCIEYRVWIMQQDGVHNIKVDLCSFSNNLAFIFLLVANKRHGNIDVWTFEQLPFGSHNLYFILANTVNTSKHQHEKMPAELLGWFWQISKSCVYQHKGLPHIADYLHQFSRSGKDNMKINFSN